MEDWKYYCGNKKINRKQFCNNTEEDYPGHCNKSEDGWANPDINKAKFCKTRTEMGEEEELVEGFSTPSVFNVQNLVKYLVEGLAVAVVGMVLVLRKKRGKVNWNRQAIEVSVMAVTAAVVFAVLDNMAPAISDSARQGAGFGLGANLVGFPVLR